MVRIFPNEHSCQPLVRALCVEVLDAWVEAKRHLNMDLLEAHKRDPLRRAA